MTARRTTREGGLPEAPRPKQHLSLFRERHPHAFKLADAVHAEKGGLVPNWPDWCFLPFDGAHWILYGENFPQHPVQVGDAFKLCGLAAWRATQRIYRPDPKLIDEAHDADLDWRIPDDLFSRLPEWCVYVETPGTALMNMPTAGFFAHLVTASGYTPQLRLLLDVDDTPESRRYMGHPSAEERPEGRPRLFSFAIDHSAGGLREGVSMTMSHVVEMADQYWEIPVTEGTWEVAKGIEVDSFAYHFLWPVVLLDRVCSSEAEYREAGGRLDRPANPKPEEEPTRPEVLPAPRADGLEGALAARGDL